MEEELYSSKVKSSEEGNVRMIITRNQSPLKMVTRSCLKIKKIGSNNDTDVQRSVLSTIKRTNRKDKITNENKNVKNLRSIKKANSSNQMINKPKTRSAKKSSNKINKNFDQFNQDLMSDDESSKESSQLNSSIENTSFENIKTSTATKIKPKKAIKKVEEDMNSSFSVSIPSGSDLSHLSRQLVDQLNFDDSNDLNGLTMQSKSAFDIQVDYELEELPDVYDYKTVKLKEDFFTGYDEEKRSLNFLIKNAIERGESGTVLIYGGPGSGKTKFVQTCLNESEFASNCRILRLDGSIHGNDVTTVQHIAKFFDIQYNDLPRVMEKFKDDCKRRIANVIIVLDEFEVFCDKNQYLLYNFFDLIQYVGYILVIGITSRFDCIELLEKRVKSRMKHKSIILKPPFENLGEYLEFAKKLIDKEDIKFTKQFQHNLELQYSKSYSIAQLKLCLLYNMRSKSAAVKINQGPVERYLTGEDEKVSLICNYLSNLEICVLLLASKLVYVKEYERFSINHLMNLKDEIPSQISRSLKTIYFAVAVLIDYDLFVIEEKKTLQNKKLYLTEWTPLVLNVFKFQIDDSLKRLENKLPTGVHKLASI